jgi:Fur family transcriptional regulator, ferric uptake regulator
MSKEQLKKAGLKITGPRVKIFQVLTTSDKRHLSAEDIYHILHDQDEDIGLATVYRVLTQFESSGLIHRHRFDEDCAVFELSDGEHHDHLVCINCQKVVEFVDNVIEQRQEDIAKNNGFEITDHSLYIYGTCPACTPAYTK